MAPEMAINLLFTLATLPLLGAILAAVPWLMPKNECFAVTVPASAKDEPVVRRLMRGYSMAIAATSLALTALVIIFFAQGDTDLTIVWVIISCLALPLFSFALMLWGRKRVQQLKRERGWHATSSKRAAVIAEGDIPQALDMRWELVNVPIIVLTAIICLVGYPSAPDQIPMHVGFSGEITSYAPKSLQTVMMPVLIQTFFVVCMAFAHWSITRSKRVTDADAPVSSAYAYGLFARAQSLYLVVFGAILNLSLILIELSMLGKVGILQASAAITVVAVAAAIGSVAMSVVYGQSGSRIRARIEDPSSMPPDDDEFWKLGIFYLNRDDPSLFVPDRFGVGWTSNFGRPASWAIIAGFIALTIGFLVVIGMMA